MPLPDPPTVVTRGFRGRRPEDSERAARTPPGQYLVEDFPVLTAGPTQHVDPQRWRLVVDGRVATPLELTLSDLLALPQEAPTFDIHCVTRWSKLDTTWRGVAVATLLALAAPTSDATHVLAHGAGGYTTNLELDALAAGQAWVVHQFDGAPLEPVHGGPVRMVVPARYFWKSTKWLTRIEVLAADRRGFWEELGYHDHGDPWAEQRHWGD